jgi:hypothetical protein
VSAARSCACRAAYRSRRAWGALLADLIEGTFGGVETVARGVEGALGPLHRGPGPGERVLGGGQPAP